MTLPLLTVAHSDGTIIDATTDQLAAIGIPADVTLSAVQAALKKRVDDKAESLRLTLITPGVGQAMEYQEAYAQAQSALAASGAVAASNYPMLAATIGIDIDPTTKKPAGDVLGVARAVKAAYENYLAAGAAIRAARLKGKADIDAALDVSSAEAAGNNIAWPVF